MDEGVVDFVRYAASDWFEEERDGRVFDAWCKNRVSKGLLAQRGAKQKHLLPMTNFITKNGIRLPSP